MLAQALIPRLRLAGHSVVAVTHEQLDVTDSVAVCARVFRERPQTVIQCAGYTTVDQAESDEGTAFRVNAEATRIVARACRKVGALLVYPSTDYVFAGTGTKPYLPDDPTGPLNVYGRSKLSGEHAALCAGRALILRTAGLYGNGGANFVEAIVRHSDEGERLEVVNDQRVRPTWTKNLSETLAELIQQEAEGVFHATDSGYSVTWYEVAREIVSFRGSSAKIEGVTQEQNARPARRPAYSVLDCSSTERLLGRRLPSWRESLRTYLQVREDSRTALPQAAADLVNPSGSRRPRL